MFPVEITTERLHLREIEEADAAAIHGWDSRPDVVRYTLHDPRSLDECAALVAMLRAGARVDPRLLYNLAVVERAGGRVIGTLMLRLEADDPRLAELGYILHPEAQGRGFAVEACRALLDFGFGALSLHRVAADIDPRNAASIRVVERLGMRREAHLVENVWCKGEWADSLLYAKLAREHGT